MSPLLLLLALQSAPTIDVEAGASGDLFPRDWARVWVTLQNPGPDLDGELRVRVPSAGGGTVELRRALTMPSKGKRRIPWDAYLSPGALDVVAELRDGTGKVVASRSVPVRFRIGQAKRVALVGARVAALDGEEFHAVRMKADLVPDRLAPLLAFDVVVFDEPAALEAGQEEALERWVEQGGVLVWSAGRLPTASARRLWRELAPAATSGLENVQAGGRTLPMARCDPKPGARAFGSIAGRPAGYRAERGRGAVVLVAPAFDAVGFDDLVDAASFRAALFPPPRRAAPPTDPRRAKNWKDVAVTEDLAALRQHLQPPDPGVDLPRLALGAGAAFVYALLVGPASWLLQRRRHFSPGWVAFVLVTAGTLGLLTLWGRFLDPQPPRIDHRVFVDPGGVQGLSFLKAGAGARHRVSFAGSLGAVLEPQFFYDRVPPVAPLHGEEGEVEVDLPGLGAVPFVWARAAAPDGEGLRARWTDGGRGAVEVRNLSKAKAYGIFLATDGDVAVLPELAPGESRTVSLSEAKRLPWADWCGLNVGKLQRSYQQVWITPAGRGYLLHATFSGQIAYAVEGKTRVGPRGLDLSPLLARGEAVVVGRLDGGVAVPASEPGGLESTWALARCIVEAP